jgi:hypothetical protein
MMTSPEKLWVIACLLVSVFTLVMVYYVGILFAVLFWIVAMLILFALQPE